MPLVLQDVLLSADLDGCVQSEPVLTASRMSSCTLKRLSMRLTSLNATGAMMDKPAQVRNHTQSWTSTPEGIRVRKGWWRSWGTASNGKFRFYTIGWLDVCCWSNRCFEGYYLKTRLSVMGLEYDPLTSNDTSLEDDGKGPVVILLQDLWSHDPPPHFEPRMEGSLHFHSLLAVYCT